MFGMIFNMLSDGFRRKESGLLRYETSDKGCGLIEVWFYFKLSEPSGIAQKKSS